jgi:hypothetical protein
LDLGLLRAATAKPKKETRKLHVAPARRMASSRFS